MQSKDHWEKVYATRASDAVSWFQPHADLSVNLIKATGVSHDASIIDVGGGASTLVDNLLANGYTNLSVLDLSAAALAAAQLRLGSRAAPLDFRAARCNGSKRISPKRICPSIDTMFGMTVPCSIF